jgi:prevent-host-death family protein
MKTIAATAFKKRCLSLLDNLDPDGVVITKHGRPVARLIPVECCADLIASMKGKIKIRGNIFSTGAKWRASE